MLLPIKWSQIPMPGIWGAPSPSRSYSLYLPAYLTWYLSTLTLSLWLNISHVLLPKGASHSFILFTQQTFIECLLYIIFSELLLNNWYVLGFILEPVSRVIGKGIMSVNGERPRDIFGEIIKHTKLGVTGGAQVVPSNHHCLLYMLG